jgi:hypothetical protein
MSDERIAMNTLVWKQPKWSSDHFELMGGQQVVGELWWTKCLSDQAVARYGGSTWLFDRPGFFRDRVVAVERGSGAPAASFAFGWLKDGELVLADGRSFRWFRTKVLGLAWALVDLNGVGVFDIELGMDWFKRQAVVRLQPGARSTAGIGLMLCMGMYLGICIDLDTAAVAAVTPATCG